MFRDRQFLLEVRTIAVPITIQSLVMSLLLTVDQLMVGRLGETSVASVGIASKITGIVTVVLAGLATGISVFCAQYWGKGDQDRIRHVLGLGLGWGLGFSGIMTALVSGFPSAVMAPFTTDPQVLREGGGFVRILALGYVPTMLTMVYSAVLRSTGQVRLLLYASISAVGVNVLLDYLLIFGHAGLPRMGLAGAAMATTIARCVEFGLVVGPAYTTRHVVAVRRLRQLRGTDRGLARSFLAVSLPLAVNELLWILGESAYVVAYGRMGTEQMTAMTMTFPLQTLSIGLLTGMSGAASVLVGQRLGRRDFDGAADYAHKVIRLGILISLVVGVAVAAGSGWYVSLYNTSADVQRLGRLCLLVFCAFLWVKVTNMIMAGSVLNAGGDSRFVLAMESTATWAVGVPTAFVGAFVAGLSVQWVYLLLSLEEVVRLGLGYLRFVSRRWVRTLAQTPDASD